jgi:hypothetical protein
MGGGADRLARAPVRLQGGIRRLVQRLAQARIAQFGHRVFPSGAR